LSTRMLPLLHGHFFIRARISQPFFTYDQFFFLFPLPPLLIAASRRGGTVLLPEPGIASSGRREGIYARSLFRGLLSCKRLRGFLRTFSFVPPNEFNHPHFPAVFLSSVRSMLFRTADSFFAFRGRTNSSSRFLSSRANLLNYIPLLPFVIKGSGFKAQISLLFPLWVEVRLDSCASPI